MRRVVDRQPGDQPEGGFLVRLGGIQQARKGWRHGRWAFWPRTDDAGIPHYDIRGPARFKGGVPDKLLLSRVMPSGYSTSRGTKIEHLDWYDTLGEAIQAAHADWLLGQFGTARKNPAKRNTAKGWVEWGGGLRRQGGYRWTANSDPLVAYYFLPPDYLKTSSPVKWGLWLLIVAPTGKMEGTIQECLAEYEADEIGEAQAAARADWALRQFDLTAKGNPYRRRPRPGDLLVKAGWKRHEHGCEFTLPIDVSGGGRFVHSWYSAMPPKDDKFRMVYFCERRDIRSVDYEPIMERSEALTDQEVLDLVAVHRALASFGRLEE
jgi:hypothetical protein